MAAEHRATMKSDPSTRRARNLLLLVVATVAVPSLLLTVLGWVAVDNEEAASRRRLEKAYYPFLVDLAGIFNQRVDAWIATSDGALDALLHVADDPEDSEAATIIRGYARAHPHAVNFFVVDGESPMLPRADHEPSIEELPPSLREALERERRGEPVDHRALLTPSLSPSAACAVRLAALLAEAGRGAQVRTGALAASGCEAWAGHDLAAKALVVARELRSPTITRIDRDARALAFADELADPLLDAPLLMVSLVAHHAAHAIHEGNTVHDDHAPTGRRALETLLAIAERPRLLAYVAAMSHHDDEPARIAAYPMGEWRRVLFTRAVDGRLVGYELVPSRIEPILADAIAERAGEEGIRAELHGMGPTSCDTKPMKKEDMEGRVAAWVLLKKSDLSWTMNIVLAGPTTALSVSRSQLYAWALALLAAALVGGIAYTIRTVIQEARLSRLKTDFVSSVSHDLRTPLTSIRMYTETLLLGRTRSRAEELEFLQVIADETERLSRLTERILDFSRMEAGRKAYHFSPEDVRDVIRQALAACRPMVEGASFDVKAELAADLPSIQADRDAMIEVLINLITNAIKYSPDAKQLVVRARADGDRVAISVCDRGIGIARADQRRIFEKFYRVECRRTLEVDGSGIGLALVDHIVRAHQGDVSVDSKLGEGSTFTVRIPASREASSVAAAAVGVESWRASSS
jgi:signal transduction histidine kinase